MTTPPIETSIGIVEYRRLMSTISKALYDWNSNESDQYTEALEEGQQLRHSWTPPDPLGDQQPDEIDVVAYTDPLDGSPRYAIRDASPAELDIVDCATQAEAEALYEQWVRRTADCGDLYAHTDVPGVGTRDSDDEEY